MIGGTLLASNHIKALGMDSPITTITTKISSVRVYNRFVGISSLTPTGRMLTAIQFLVAELYQLQEVQAIREPDSLYLPQLQRAYLLLLVPTSPN